jgi:hypothetical protein
MQYAGNGEASDTNTYMRGANGGRGLEWGGRQRWKEGVERPREAGSGSVGPGRPHRWPRWGVEGGTGLPVLAGANTWEARTWCREEMKEERARLGNDSTRAPSANGDASSARAGYRAMTSAKL